MGEATDRGWTSARSESSPAPPPLRPQTLTGFPPVTQTAAAAGGCCQCVNEASERHHREGDHGTPGPPPSQAVTAFQKEAGFRSQPCPFQAEVSGSHRYSLCLREVQCWAMKGHPGQPRRATCRIVWEKRRRWERGKFQEEPGTRGVGKEGDLSPLSLSFPFWRGYQNTCALPGAGIL